MRLHYQRKLSSMKSLIGRLGLDFELSGHGGCVNCIEWNREGTILASGSDDFHVMLWDPIRRKRLVDIDTGHQGNIFSVKVCLLKTLLNWFVCDQFVLVAVYAPVHGWFGCQWSW